MKALGFLLWAVLAAGVVQADEIKILHEQVLYPSVRVRAGSSGGSGTVLYSEKDALGKVRTFILTNHHVIDDLIDIGKKWNSRLSKWVEEEKRKTAEVHFFRYNNMSTTIGSYAVEADVVAYDEDDDMALLELRDTENKADYVAVIIKKEQIKTIHMFEPVYVSGSTLGHPPIASYGMMTYQNDEIESKKFWMTNASISFGNSGGGLFIKRGGRYVFIGVPSRIQMQGFSPANFMAYFIPPDRVIEFLEDQSYQFIFDASRSIEDCKRERDTKTLMEQTNDH